MTARSGIVPPISENETTRRGITYVAWIGAEKRETAAAIVPAHDYS